MLPALTSPGARYRAVYSSERLLGGYRGPLAYAALAKGAAGGVDLGAGRERITAADLPAPVTPLYGWYGRSGSGRHVVQDVLAHRPRLRADVTMGGRLAAAFAGLANDPAFASLSGPQSLIAGARGEALVIHPTTSLQNAVWSEHADGAGAVWRDLFVSLGANGALGAAQQTTSVHIASVPQVLLLTEGLNGATQFRDGVPTALRPGDSSALARLTLGASTLGAQLNANFRLAAYLAIEGTVSTADAAAITVALQSRFAVRAQHVINLVHIGDSIVGGRGGERHARARHAIAAVARAPDALLEPGRRRADASAMLNDPGHARGRAVRAGQGQSRADRRRDQRSRRGRARRGPACQHHAALPCGAEGDGVPRRACHAASAN